MHYFDYKNDTLCCEEVSIDKIAKAVGTPAYIYSYQTVVEHFRAFDAAFQEVPHIVCFAMKANSNLAVLKVLGNEGSGADIVSGGELYRCLKAGIPASKIVFSGVGKTRKEIEEALQAGILSFNIESTQELAFIDQIAGELHKKAPISPRINPNVDPKTHPYISTGLRENKFGIPMQTAIELLKSAKDFRNIEIVGVSSHIGSQITKIQPFVDALERILSFVEEMRGMGFDIKHIDVGGGLGITYKDETPPHPEELGKVLTPMMKKARCTFLFEPGRFIVGNAGILVTQVLYDKINEGKSFKVVDVAMNDLIRPSLYGSYHEIRPVIKKDQPIITADIVGPVCESGDFMAKNRAIPDVQPGEFLALMSAGAYGFVMSSNYNSRPRIPEILVKGDTFYVVRQRERYEDLILGEEIPNV
jgi:diaminopimelate decarboxylase